MQEWGKVNFKELELWQEIVKTNAAINNTPHIVANNAIASYREQFSIKKQLLKLSGCSNRPKQ